MQPQRWTVAAVAGHLPPDQLRYIAVCRSRAAVKEPAMTSPDTSSGMLASSAERDAAAQRLQVAFAEQRLTDDEFDHRIRVALTAKTTAELELITADLPAT